MLSKEGFDALGPVFAMNGWVFFGPYRRDRKSTRLNSSHSQISYAVFCLKKKKSREDASWYPDALIPFVNPPDGRPLKNARFVGAPFEAAPKANQPVWVDVFVPKDAAPGTYSGTVTVTAQDQKAVMVPVRLTVWNFTLPDTPSMRSNFGDFDNRVAAAHKVGVKSKEFRELERRYAEALAAHRVCPPIPGYLYPKANADGSIEPAETHAALKEWVNRFHVTGFPIALIGRDPLGKDRERNVRYLR